MSCDSFLAGESDPVVGGQTPFADRGGQRFRGRTNPDCQRNILPVELAGSVISTGCCVFHRLLFQENRIQAVQNRLVGATFNGVFIVTLGINARPGLISSQGSSPPPRRSIGDRKELTPLSNHAFVRSMVRTWCHSRHLIEELAPRVKANKYHNTNCKK